MIRSEFVQTLLRRDGFDAAQHRLIAQVNVVGHENHLLRLTLQLQTTVEYFVIRTAYTDNVLLVLRRFLTCSNNENCHI